MKVSVIIPNYNHAAYLPQRIDSVLQQTFQDFELILLDDKSTDTSPEILAGYTHHPKVSCLVLNSENSGSTFKQWNKGVALAKGELIWIAESDDSADPTFLATLVQLLEHEPTVGLAYSNSYVIDAQQNVLSTYANEYASWSSRWQHDFVNEGTQEVVDYLRFATVILNVSSCVFRKSLFLEIGGSPEEYTLSGDWLTYVKMLQRADIAYCAKPLNYFRTHAKTVRSSSRQYVHFMERLKVLHYIYENFQITGAQKKDQVYSILADYVKVQEELSSLQRKTILRFMRHNIMRTLDYMLFKYKASLLLHRAKTSFLS